MPQLSAAVAESVETTPAKGERRYGKRVQIPARPDTLIEPEIGHGDPPDSERVPWIGAAELLRRTAAVKRKWLVQRVVPQGSYGSVGAAAGVGKSWVGIDLAVSVATGSAWLDTFPCGRGRVALVYGEGEQHDLARRIAAVCRSKGIDPAEMDGWLWLCPYPLDLSDKDTLGEIAEWLRAVKPALVIVDPLYLMQGGVSGRNVAEMGGLLRGITEPCLRVGAALLTITHFNKTGQGNGQDRITGAGTQEWARFIVTLSAEYAYPQPEGDEHDTRDVQLSMEFSKAITGRYLVRRRTWTDDPDELDSPMHYKVRVYEDGGQAAAGKGKARPSETERKIEAAIAKLGPKASAASIVRESGVSAASVARFRRKQRDLSDGA